jgi:hypothetical protein
VKERGHTEDLGIDGRTILTWIFEIHCKNMHWNLLTQDRVRCWGSCKFNNEPLDFIKGKKFLDQLSHYLFLKDFASWN